MRTGPCSDSLPPAEDAAGAMRPGAAAYQSRDDDAGMMPAEAQPLIVQASEVRHVERQENTAFLRGSRKLRYVGLAETVRLGCRHGIDASPAEFARNGAVQVLIGEEADRHHGRSLPVAYRRRASSSSSAARSASISSACS